MQVVQLYGPRDLRVDDVPEPKPLAGEVLLRIRAVGVCGSDVHYYLDGGIGDTAVPFPFVMGHECAGEVVALGRGVERLSVGTRVAVDPAMPCESCEICREGNDNCCPNVRFLGSPPIPGALSEYLAHPAHLCIPLPDELDFADGAMLEPLGVAIHALTLARIRPGDSVAVVGAGPIGLLVLQLAVASWTSAVYVSEPILERRTLAAEFGAAAVHHPGEADPADWLMAQTGGRGVDAVIEVAWGGNAVGQAVRMARPAGRVVLVGIPRENVTAFPADVARRNGLTVLVSRRMRQVYRRGVALVSKGLVDQRSLITHRLPLERTSEAFELLSSVKDGVVKALIGL